MSLSRKSKAFRLPAHPLQNALFLPHFAVLPPKKDKYGYASVPLAPFPALCDAWARLPVFFFLPVPAAPYSSQSPPSEDRTDWKIDRFSDIFRHSLFLWEYRYDEAEPSASVPAASYVHCAQQDLHLLWPRSPGSLDENRNERHGPGPQQREFPSGGLSRQYPWHRIKSLHRWEM